MKRSAIHFAFAGVALCVAAIALHDWSIERHARSIAQAIASVTRTVTPRQPHGENEAAQVQLARAVAASKAADYSGAQRLYDALIAQDDDASLRSAALFDLANMYLRQAAGPDAGGPIRSWPLLEQAKERYRSALRLVPDDWDARYNLERALWLAPEGQASEEELDTKKQTNVKVRGAESEDLP